MRRLAPFALFAAITTVSACDELDNDFERGALGAAIGCAAGEILVEGRCVEGAVIGGAAGVLSDDI